jgi:hypothetical protein
MAFHADGVLAGAYRGSRAGLSKTLLHAVSDVPFTIGRLKRDFGQALCVPSLDMAGYFQPLAEVTCPRCRDIITRLIPSCPR